MKLEYINDWGNNSPLIRMYNGDQSDYKLLINAIDQLLSKKNRKISIDSLHSFKSINNIRLEFVMTEFNSGLIQIAPHYFQCMLNKAGWTKIKHLILPFLSNGENRFQWLDETSDISLLLSDSGEW